MKNQDIVFMVNAGVLAISNHSLSAAQAYKVFKFKKWLKSAFESLQESERAILEECGIPDAMAFDARNAELQAKEDKTTEDAAELASNQEKLRKFLELREQLNRDDLNTEGLKAMPYEDWHNLQNENAEVEINGKKSDILSGYVEEVLEGVLWLAPEE